MAFIDSSTLLDSLNWRYATKSFDPAKSLAEGDIQTLQESMRLSPSSFGLQPWHFLWISSQDIREELKPHAWGQAQVTDCSHFVVLCTRTDIGVPFVDDFIEKTAQARDQKAEDLAGYRDMMVDFITRMTLGERMQWSKAQTYLALQRLMDTAALLKVDACPMEGFLPPEFDRILNLQEKNLTSSVCCALGYRSEDDKYATAPKVRAPMADIVTEL